MKAKGLGRSLKYWGWILEKTMLQMISMMLLIGTLMTLMDEGNFIEGFLKMMCAYLVMLAIMTIFMNSMNTVTTYFPMTVSMGSTRKQSYIAMQVMQHLQLVQYGLLIYLAFYFADKEALTIVSPYMLSAVGMAFLLMGVGNLIATIFMRFGRAIAVVIYILIFVLLISLFVGGALAGNAGWINAGGAFVQFLGGPWLLFIGIVADAAMIAVFYNAVGKKDLQFV